MPAEPMSIIVQERRRMIRVGLADILGRQPQLEVVDVVVTGEQLVSSVIEHRPDAVLIELDAPWDVRDIVERMRAAVPGVRVTALHHGRLSDHARRAADIQVDALAAYGGGTYAIAAAILGEPVLIPDRGERRRLPSRTVLTPRECQVLRHLAEGKTAADCAAALQVSPKTVDNHKQRIFSKLGVQNQAHAVALAHRIGLLGRPRYDNAASG